MEPLSPAFFQRDALALAGALLGCHLVHDDVVVRITETEAYRFPDDTASHASHGVTPRNRPMFGPPGHAYVYLCYGIHHLLNVVARPPGEPAAVLIRAAAPVGGEATIAARRGGRRGPDSLAGPGRVGQALGLDTSFSGAPLFDGRGLYVAAGPAPADVLVGPRIGIDYAEPRHREAPWRLAEAGSRWVSHRRSLRPPSAEERRILDLPGPVAR
jgi:DNA-3-methyladenine glycosylase